MASVEICQLFIGFLETHGAYDKFLENFEAYGRRYNGVFGSRNFNDYCYCTSADNLLSRAFAFRYAPEGGIFWIDLDEAWKDILRGLGEQ